MAKKLDIKGVGEKALDLTENLLKKKAEGIVSIARTGENGGEWKVLAEVLERKAVPDTQDILGTYELKLTGDLELTGYRRIGMRRRSELAVLEED